MADGKTQTNPEVKDIDLIPGNTHILLIAPHGHKDDDENTGKLVRLIAKQSGSYAIINEIYRKPNPPDDDEIANKATKRVNLNRIRQVSEHLKKEFLNPLLAYKNKIIEQYGKCYVFWIHGAADLSVETDSSSKDVQALIGYGQDTVEAEQRHTVLSLDIIETIIQGLNQEGLKAVRANDTIRKENIDKEDDDKQKSFCGWDRHNMNQLFAVKDYEGGSTDYIDENVQSIQLEFRMLGCRDEDSLNPTAVKFLNAISALVQPKEESGKKVAAQAAEVDDAKVEKAYNHLKDIFVKHFQNAMLESGQYLIQQFYNGKYELAQEKKFTKNKSLAKLIQKIQEDSQEKGNAPSRTWVYDAVNLAIDNHLYEQKKLPSVYGQLGHSHKVNLTNAPDNVVKATLAKEAVENKYTVAKLRERIREEKQNQDADYIPMKEAMTNDHLMTFDTKRLKALKKQIQTLEKKTQEDLTIYQGNLEQIEKAIKAKPAEQKAKKPTGFQEWTKKENNINISTGCSNDCKYCYAKSMAYRFKRIKEGQWVNEQVREKDVKKKRKLYDGKVGFPTAHDITAANIDAYLEVLEKLLTLGNELLIVSKPNFDCIKRICEIGSAYKDKILFRFTIGAMDDGILEFWDTKAPLYEERKKCLIHASDNGFQTSVSMEPLLEPSRVLEMANDLIPYISDFIWIGMMNHTSRLRTKAQAGKDQEMIEHIDIIEKGQTDEKVKAIYSDFQKEPELLKKIKWKDSYKKVLGIKAATEPGLDI